ncbi:hypothetical protein SLEP1_g49108 [Rubroshorea leprosula]|uniref:Pentatricopeptide repeat-containing protein n=1 Tax=Rubroshorea leprosula TaxID=152421 RepID=A0AAV5LVQ7_9ROSI|nr:hypothetical protein SLEP1_g49108 [Rubroshorea leprosula]
MMVFKSLKEPGTMMWNLIIKYHVDFGYCDEALLLYGKMREVGVRHDSFTFPVINRAVLGANGGLCFGEIVHCLAMKIGFGLDLYFGNTLIEVYGKFGCIGHAYKVFDEMLERDLVTWTSMISVLVSEGNVGGSFTLFEKMRASMEPNSVTLIVLFRGCCDSGSLIEGRQMHGYVIKSGALIDGFVQNSVLRLYKRMGTDEEVENFFGEIHQRDVVSWNTLISFYSLTGDIEQVAKIFCKMRGEVEVSMETLTLAISALAKSGNLSQGEQLHCCAIKLGLQDDALQTSLLDFYGKCGKLGNSTLLLREITGGNTIAQCAMMSSYIQNGYFKEAIEFFQKMQPAGHKPRPEILSNVLNACTHLGILQFGREIHGYSLRNSFYSHEEDNACLETSILNMYIRCGSISSARLCFDRMLVKDVVAWTSMIEGYATHGFGLDALELFCQMIEEGVTPNSVTFLSLLSAFSHSGLVGEGCKAFHSMKWRFGIEPNLDHYTCIVDLLGRSGMLKEALTIIMKMTAFPDGRIWGALLSASVIHGDRELGEYAAQRILELEPDNVGYYTLLSNVQACTGKWNEVEEVRKAMFEKDLKKKPGWSFIEEKGNIHCFVSGDRSHNQVEVIYDVLRCLRRKVQEPECLPF